MLFNSVSFLLFFPAVCVLYYAIPAEHVRVRNALLLAASYYFYMNWEPVYALLLLGCTLATWAQAQEDFTCKAAKRRQTNRNK